jgi:homospermidine synthase
MKHVIHGRIDGPLVMIGYGSIGRGALQLILRHFKCDRSKVVVIAPHDKKRGLEKLGVRFKKAKVTSKNYRGLLLPMLKAGPGQAFLVNLSVGVSSIAMIELCREANALYIDTVIEPWPEPAGRPLTPAQSSNYAAREELLEQRRAHPDGPTAVSCCGANPGMVSWFVKQALLKVAAGVGVAPGQPTSRDEWGRLMQRLGVKGVHIAERDTQRAKAPKPMGVFVNTWSVPGFIAEGQLKPAELGWGTHEKALPPDARRHESGCDAAVYLLRPGADTRVRTWCPTAGPQYGFLVTHNESISIADYFTVREKGEVVYRPTCHYAYHPANDAVLSLHELFGSGGKKQPESHVLEESEILDGIDELGVLLYGHAKNAYWYGSRLSIEKTRRLAPHQNATGLQVTSAVMAGMAWALENPRAGIVEADDMDYRRCLEIQRPYLGPVTGMYTDWTPLQDRGKLFPEDLDMSDPWQFKNVIVR